MNSWLLSGAAACQMVTRPGITSGQIEMPSYRGVLSEQQLEALVLYIKSLTGRRPANEDADKE